MQKILFLFGTVISLPVLVANEACEFSRWGEGDEIGNANLINAESILKASQLIKKGKAYSLGVIIDQNTPAYPPRSLSLQVVQPTGQCFARTLDRRGPVGELDVFPWRHAPNRPLEVHDLNPR